MDNHASHIDFRVIAYAKENEIVLLTFPPHCSHALQPCDVSVFGPFKRALRSSHNDWIQMNPGKRIGNKEVAGLRKGPFLSKVTAENIIPGFQSTGIWPFNRTAILTSKFAPSIVTDRPDPNVNRVLSSLMSNNENLSNVVPTTRNEMNGANIQRNVTREEAFHVELNSNGIVY